MDVPGYEVFRINEYRLTVMHLVYILLIYLGARNIALKHNKLDKGSRYALWQIIRYIVWTIVIVLSLESLGVKVTIFIAGSAALLVSIGLGLQQTFSDIVSGIILLIEGSVKVDDTLDVEGEVVRVTKISLRTSMAANRNGINYILPNSKIVTDQVINRNHNFDWARFIIRVSVSYGSDVKKVVNTLVNCVKAHPQNMADRSPIARLAEFDDSSLNFEVLFWSTAMFEIEQVKSEIRVAIVEAFQQNDIVIPFPQRDLYLKSSNIGSLSHSNGQ